MSTHAITETKAQLAKLVEKAENGEDVILRRHNRPVAKIVPLSSDDRRMVPGLMRGKLKMADDFEEWPEGSGRP